LVNNDFKDLLETIDHLPNSDILSSHLEAAKSELRFFRSRVNSFTQKYKELLIDSFQNKIFKVILNVYDASIKSCKASEVKGNLKYSVLLDQVYANAESERSFIYYIIRVSKPLDYDDLKIWDGTIGNDGIARL